MFQKVDCLKVEVTNAFILSVHSFHSICFWLGGIPLTNNSFYVLGRVECLRVYTMYGIHVTSALPGLHNLRTTTSCGIHNAKFPLSIKLWRIFIWSYDKMVQMLLVCGGSLGIIK